MALEVARSGNTIDLAEPLAHFITQQVKYLGLVPNIELTFDTLAIRIFGAVKSTRVIPHIIQQIVKRFPGNSFIKRVAHNEMCFQVSRCQLGVVVQHLFKMRNKPTGVYTVSGKATAEVIENAAVRHLVQCQQNHLLHALALLAQLFGWGAEQSQQQGQIHGMGKLGG